MANTNIDLVSLDFFALKNSLKTYLKDNTQFKDYDFEGSNMNLLLDLLSYNTHKNAFYLNMLLSESFLDSAQLTASVMSHAKELNYVPRSARSSKAKIRVKFDATGESAPYLIKKGSTCTTLIKNAAYVFTIPDSIYAKVFSVNDTTTTYTFDTEIYEGLYVSDVYNFQPNKENQTFKITNKNIDTTSLVVLVNEDNSEVGETYTLSSTLLDLNYKSKVYFLQTSPTGGYEILFGDGILGYQPKTGSTIVLEYRVAKGSVANGAKQFTLDFDPTNANELRTSPVVTLLETSQAGDEQESLESVRYYAPKHFQVQERTITSSDYAVALKTRFPEINAVHAYGGEELTPPMFGKVYVAVDISNVNGLPDSKRREYYNFIKRKCPFSIEPIFVLPEYSYLSTKVKVRYNVNVTALTAENIKSIVRDTITQYKNDHLNGFNVILRYSKLASHIDNSHPSIISSFTDVKLYKKIVPPLGIPQNYVLNFETTLIDTVPEKDVVHTATDLHAVQSSVFYYRNIQCILEDDGQGKIALTQTDGIKNSKLKDVGTVDYKNGIIYLTELQVDSLHNNVLNVYVTPKDLDVVADKNTILTIDDDAIDITVEQLKV